MYCATLNTQCTELPPCCCLAWWYMYAALQSRSIGAIPRSVILFFRFFLFNLFYNKIYCILYLTFSLFYATYSVQRFL